MLVLTVIFTVTWIVSAGKTIDQATLQNMCDNYTSQVTNHLPHIQTHVTCPSVPVDQIRVGFYFSTDEHLIMGIHKHPYRLPYIVLVTTSENENTAESHLLLEIAKSTFNVPLEDMVTWNLQYKMPKPISEANVNEEL
ncbi:hypothetical protein Ddc_16403 [Ditylenchus destructor]|nr:hypothetical protein Ddc_16403 [Ditylenchus destructor]